MPELRFRSSGEKSTILILPAYVTLEIYAGYEYLGGELLLFRYRMIAKLLSVAFAQNPRPKTTADYVCAPE